jgi:hypothetical protein
MLDYVTASRMSVSTGEMTPLDVTLWQSSQ